ncbi:MAG: hypothetical protein ACOY3P_25895 [Planctomycetota bacterium]
MTRQQCLRCRCSAAYASIIRDIRKGKDARFVKTDRGTFALAGKN